jgi:hypothetical protein
MKASHTESDVVAHTCNPSIWEAEAESQFQDWPGLQSKTLSQERKKKKSQMWWLKPVALVSWEAEVWRTMD